MLFLYADTWGCEVNCVEYCPALALLFVILNNSLLYMFPELFTPMGDMMAFVCLFLMTLIPENTGVPDWVK